MVVISRKSIYSRTKKTRKRKKKTIKEDIIIKTITKNLLKDHEVSL